MNKNKMLGAGKGVAYTIKKMLSLKESVVFLIIVLLAVVLGIASPYFFTKSNLMTTMVGLSTDGIIVIGMTIVLVLGGIDLSVGSIMGFSCLISATFAVMGLNMWLCALIGMGMGVFCGFINGILIGKVGLNAFITTLAMQGIASGTTMFISQGSSISLKEVAPSFKFIAKGEFLGVQMIVIVFIVLVIVGEFLLRKSVILRKTYYIGSNEKAAELSGINIQKAKIGVYTLSALLASFAGILSLARFSAATTTTGSGAELDAISAAVIGGASLSGGQGSIIGAVLGVILLNFVNNGLVLLNVSIYGQQLISGAILLIAVLLDHYGNRAKMRKG